LVNVTSSYISTKNKKYLKPTQIHNLQFTHFNNKSRSIKVRNVNQTKETVLFFALYIVCFFSHQMSCFVFIFSLNSVPDEERQSLIRTAETHI